MSVLFRLRKIRSCCRASVAVEFAMLMPLLVMVIFGIVVFGSYLAVVHGVQQLAAEAARSSIAGLNDAERATLATTYVAVNAPTYPLIDSTKLTISAAASGAGPNIFVVTVNYDASSMFIYGLPSVFAPPTTISRAASIPYGGF